MLPNLIMPGAQKSGTTFLAALIAQHPEIFLPSVKEPAHFLTAIDKPLAKPNGKPQRLAYAKSDTYRALYADGAQSKYRLDASTGYFAVPGVARAIRQEIGEAKIICVVRQPVDRAYSAYVYHRQLEDTSCASFEDALDEERSINERGEVVIPQPYFGTGEYARNISVWQSEFGFENVLVLFFEDLLADPQRACSTVFDFLDLEPFTVDPVVEKNASHEPLTSWRRLVLMASRGDLPVLAPVSFVMRTLIPPAKRNDLRLAIKRNLRPSPGSKRPPKLGAEQRAKYTRRFHDDIDQLARMTGKDLSHWKAD